ncbi:MAG: hypothetical protein ACRDL4_15255 [Thermoleophilaceae bacterium]
MIAHHAGEGLVLAAALGSGAVSGALLVLRARIAELARRRSRGRP